VQALAPGEGIVAGRGDRVKGEAAPSPGRFANLDGMATLTATPIHEDWLFEDSAAGATPGYTAANWREDLSHSRTDVISRDRSLATVTTVVDFAKYKSAVKFILGYSYVDGNKKLRRETPAFHPQWPWLYARAITNVTFLDFNGKAIDAWEGSLYYATYVYAMVTVEFAEVRYEIWEDDEVSYEYERYLERKPKPYVELNQVDGGSLTISTPTAGDPNGKPFIAAPYVLARQEKSMFQLVWHEVPRDLIEDSDGNRPKFKAIQKKVNTTAFMGHAAGTLLCEDVEAEDMPSPIATDLFSGLQFTSKVTMTLKEFDPPRGDINETRRGWNLLPWNAPSTFYWYVDPAGNPLYSSYEFAKFFTHYSL
jgi:hypothetical protein